MDLYQLIYALCAAASAVSGGVILLGMAAFVIKRAFLTPGSDDFSRPRSNDLNRYYK